MIPINQAILSIYDSAIDLSIWEKTLDACVNSVGALSGSLMFSEESINGHVQWATVGGSLKTMNPEILSYYNENLIHHELEGWELMKQHPCQTLRIDTDAWPQTDEELLKRADYAFLLKHNGTLRRVGARLNNYPTWSDLIAFQFSAEHSLVPQASIAAMKQLLPHVAKSIEVGRSFSLLRARYQAVLAALDFVDVGMSISLENGTLIVNNTESRRIFQETDGVKLDKKNKLVINENKTNELLQHALINIAKTSAGQDSLSEVTLAIDRPSGRRPFLVEISPLRDTHAELDHSLHGALVMIIDPENAHDVNVNRLGLAYSLTSAELSVAKRLIEGWTQSNIAEERNVSPETVKSQTSTIMRKTNTGKRSDLIRLALKLTPPIRVPESSLPE